MQAALAEKVARDAQESAEKERKVELREEYKQRMAAWRQVRPLAPPCQSIASALRWLAKM